MLESGALAPSEQETLTAVQVGGQIRSDQERPPRDGTLLLILGYLI